MRVTLKRADFYAKAALKAANEGKYETAAKLSIYAPVLASVIGTAGVEDEVRLLHGKTRDQHQLSLDLITACYAIRAQLAAANLQHGISAALNRNAAMAAKEARTRALLKAIDDDAYRGERTAKAVLSKAAAMRDKPTEGYGLRSRDEVVTINVFGDEDVETLRKQLKRIIDQRATGNDLLTAANVSNEIVLSEATIATLKRADILPSE